MKAMILSAGRGERMRPLTDTVPKALLKAAGKSLIEYHIEALVKAGITELVINLAWLGEKIEAQLGDGSQYGAKISYSREEQALETAGGIIKALSLLGEEPFIVINGDIFTDYSFAQLQSLARGSLKADQTAHLVLIPNPEHHKKGDFYCHNHQLSDDEDVNQGQRYTFSGIAYYKPEFFQNTFLAQESVTSGIIEKQKLAPLLRAAMKEKKVSGEVYKGLWLDIGTPERLQEINKQLEAKL